ncbi:MAG: hypothetical protein AABW80_01495 [Nanoarchaeota archaeon]
MKNIKKYAGIAIATLALPILSHVSGLSRWYGDKQIFANRMAHSMECRRSGSINNCEAHYRANEDIYHTSAEFGITGLVGLLGLLNSLNKIANERERDKLRHNFNLLQH